MGEMRVVHWQGSDMGKDIDVGLEGASGEGNKVDIGMAEGLVMRVDGFGSVVVD